MAVETDADLAVFFNAEEFGVSATYTPPDEEDGVACSVLVNFGDAELAGSRGKPLKQGYLLSVSSAEIAAPAKDGVFSIDGQSYFVISDPESADVQRAIWTMTVEPFQLPVGALLWRGTPVSWRGAILIWT